MDRLVLIQCVSAVLLQTDDSAKYVARFALDIKRKLGMIEGAEETRRDGRRGSVVG